MKIAYPSKLLLLICMCSLGIQHALAQGYTWIKGTNTVNQTGIYGIQGTAALSNMPGSREGAMSWKDAAGNFWMLGGYGNDFIGNMGYLCDLWKYNPLTSEWTYVKGSNIIAQVGTYGTQGIANAANKPGARSVGVVWQDANGKVYLFGGYGYDGVGVLGYLNDLWMYDPATNNWTWLSGSNNCYQPANYGSIATPSASNVPGARFSASGWSDANGNLWLFGGFGNTTTSLTVGFLNDLWKYDPTNNQWAWMKGSQSGNQNGDYGTISVSNATNNPGGRKSCMSWRDAAGDFWVFGGDGYDATGSSNAFLNDLWKFSVSNSEWTWLSGSSTASQVGVYGTVSVPSASNTPGARGSGISWQDGAGNFWLGFGDGYGTNSSTSGKLNDLWRYSITTNQWAWMAGTGSINFQGFYGTLGTLTATNIPGCRRNSASWVDASNNLWLFAGNGFPATGTASQLNDLWRYTNCAINPITLTVTSSQSVVCAGELVVLTASGAGSINWNTGGNLPVLSIHPTVTAVYMASTTDTNNCTYSAAYTQNVNACTSLDARYFENKISIYPNPSHKQFTVYMPSSGGEIIVYNTLGEKVYEAKLVEGNNEIKTLISKGCYSYSVKTSDNTMKKGLLLVE